MVGQYLEAHCECAVTFLCPFMSSFSVDPLSTRPHQVSLSPHSFHFIFIFKNPPHGFCPFLFLILANIDYKHNNVHMFQINQPTRCNSFTSLLLDVYVWLNMFWAPPRPSSGAYNCTRSLWFYRWRLAVGAKLQPPLSNSKDRGS